jgi:NADPH:quinone reductase-like Zn-dependent oxidoreductase
MKAVAYQSSHPIDHPDALVDTTLPDPVAGGRDLLVEVRAIRQAGKKSRPACRR